MKIEILGAHNTETDKARLPCLLIDDELALDAGGLTSSLSLQRQQLIRAVLLTHHHFDHTRDLIMLAANNDGRSPTIEVYGLNETLELVYNYLLDGKMYRDYTKWPSEKQPRLLLKPILPLQRLTVGNCTVLPVAVGHTVPSVGYLVAGDNGGSIFYAGDTGPGLSDCWRQITPRILFIEVTGPDRFEADMRRLRHLTPSTLASELKLFYRINGYIPRVIVTHIPLLYEEEVRQELDNAGKDLGMELEMAYEGLAIEV